MLIDGFSISVITMHFWTGQSDPEIAMGEPRVLHNTNILGAAWNTIELAFFSAVIASLVGLVIAYIVVRKESNPLAKMLDQISIPFLFPSIAFSAMYLTMFLTPWPNPSLRHVYAVSINFSGRRLPYS